jgi:hypothetical protein
MATGQQSQERYESNLLRARNARDRTEQWKRQRIAVEYVRHRDALRQLKEAEKQTEARRQRTLSERLFGISSLAGDTGSLTISRRDAGERAAQLNSEQAALELLRRAERSGDEPLARAIVERAVDMRWVDVANAFLQHREHLDEPLNELWQISQPSIAEELTDWMHNYVDKPPELAGMSDYEIDRLAQTADQPAGAA